jgi:hypothetical protein
MSPSRDDSQVKLKPRKDSFIFPIGEVCVGDIWEYLYRDKSLTFIVTSFERYNTEADARVRLLPSFEKGRVLFKKYDDDCVYNLIARLPDDR